MKKIVIIDYGMGNLDSIARAVEECGASPFVTNDFRDLADASSIIMPGVGAFPDGMKSICEHGLDKALKKEVIERGTPFLGICLGMQLLAEKGMEEGETEGLGWIEGEVIKLKPDEPGTKVPHIGWNEVFPSRASPLFKDIPSGKDFYFVHSYHFVCKKKEDVLARTSYCGSFVSAVGRGNIYGVQFHPEKSLRYGIKFIENFLSL